MQIVFLFLLMMVWMYFALRLKDKAMAVVWVLIGLLIPTGAVAFVLNVAWVVYKNRKELERYRTA